MVDIVGKLVTRHRLQIWSTATLRRVYFTSELLNMYLLRAFFDKRASKKIFSISFEKCENACFTQFLPSVKKI